VTAVETSPGVLPMREAIVVCEMRRPGHGLTARGSVLLVGSMVQRQRQYGRGRKATSAALRSLALLVATLLAASSLGQIAHLLVVQHTICAEHGELLELSSDGGHSAATQVEDEHSPTSTSSEEATSHEHCEILASAQRQTPLPVAAVIGLVPAAAGAAREVLPVSSVRLMLPALVVAPKTSPPGKSSRV
jgi:hypothetical protein